MDDCFEKAFYIVSMLLSGLAFGLVLAFIITTSDDNDADK